jgi:riboflavin kinase / FMN adenylyltransferase
MKVVHDAADLNPANRKVCVALGVFDGVHLGHQQVIRHTLSDAERHEALSAVITFDKHPNAIVAPARLPPLIYSLPQKLRAIATLGVDATWVIGFNEDFSRQTGEEFVRAMVRDFRNLHSVCVGSEFTFGHKRTGDVTLLRNLGSELRFRVHGLSEVSLDAKVVSSTRIREAICSGRLDSASQMMGRGYALAGQVVKGERMGRMLGFPTANIDVAGLVLPPRGVYAAHAHIEAGQFRAVVNIGVRPTMTRASDSVTVEAHLLGFGGDLYGQEVELTFVEKLRDEQKFPSVEQLRAQIARDINCASTVFDS